MTTRRDLVELVSTAFDRTPTFSGRLRQWFQLDLLQQAADLSREQPPTAGVCGLIAPPRNPSNPVSENIDRIWIATQRHSYRVERDWQDRDGTDRTSVHVSDGTTTWSPTHSGAFHAAPTIPDAFPAKNLLDPSWLLQYDWDAPLRDNHHDRDVLAMQVRLATHPAQADRERANPGAQIVLRQQPPAEVDVLIDAEYGFLHRMTGLIDSQPFVIEELLDVLLDPPLDESTFRVDPSKI